MTQNLWSVSSGPQAPRSQGAPAPFYRAYIATRNSADVIFALISDSGIHATPRIQKKMAAMSKACEDFVREWERSKG
jgi:hypothetical protein